MKKTINREHIEGRLYDHELVMKTVQKQGDNFGKEFIAGTIDIATDDEGLNIVSVHFTYVTATTSKGTANATFAALKKIIDGQCKTVLNDGLENATMLKVDTALGLNDFYSNRNGEETLVSAKRNEGGFVTIVTKLCEPALRNTFAFDMLINGTNLVEADPDKNIPADYLVVKGAVFDFRNSMLPVELIVKSKGGINYFTNLEASSSNLIFTEVRGTIESQTIVTTKEEVSAFGEPAVREYTRTIKEWVINWSRPETYELGDASTGITTDEVKTAMANREVYLAEVKKRQEEYQASKAAAPAASATSAPAAVGGFNF